MKLPTVRCANGNSVDTFYDRHIRSYVSRVLDSDGNQLDDSQFGGTSITAKSQREEMIRVNGGRIRRAKRRGVQRVLDPKANNFIMFQTAESSDLIAVKGPLKTRAAMRECSRIKEGPTDPGQLFIMPYRQAVEKDPTGVAKLLAK